LCFGYSLTTRAKDIHEGYRCIGRSATFFRSLFRTKQGAHEEGESIDSKRATSKTRLRAPSKETGVRVDGDITTKRMKRIMKVSAHVCQTDIRASSAKESKKILTRGMFENIPIGSGGSSRPEKVRIDSSFVVKDFLAKCQKPTPRGPEA
jgi:hypothetical protein